MAAKGLQVRIDADTKPFKQGLKQAETSMDKFQRSAGKAGKAVGAAMSAGAKVASVALAGITAGAVKGLKDLTELERGVREVGTLLGDVSDTDLSKVRSQVEELSKTFGQDVQILTKAYYDSISAGVPFEDAMTFLTTASKFAVAGVTDVTEAVDLMTSAMNAFRIPASEADRITDAFFSTVRFGKTTVAEIAAAFSNVGPVAATAGASIEEVGAWLAKLTLAGTPTAQATTQIRSALAELLKPAKKGAQAFAELTGETFQQSVATRGLFESLKIFTREIEATGTNVLEAFGRIEGGTAILALTGKEWDKFADIFEQVQAGAGATDQAFQTMSEGLGFSLATMNQEFKAVFRELGEALVPTLQAMQPVLIMLAQNFGTVAVQVLEAFAPALAQAAPLIAELALRSLPALASVIELLAPVLIPALEIAVIGISVAMEGLNDLIRRLIPAFKTAGEGISWLGGIFRLLDETTKGAGGAFVVAAKGMKDLGIWVWDLLKKLRELTDGAIKKLLDKAPWLVGTFKDIRDIIRWVVDGVKSLIRRFREIMPVFREIWNLIKKVMGAFTNPADGAFGLVGSVVGKAAGALKSLIPGFASGGVVTRPTLAMVGEAGPEAIIPLRRGGGGMGITLNFNGPVYGDRRQLGDAVVRALEDYVRRNGPLGGGIVR